MLLHLLGGDVSLNPGPEMLGVLNARVVKNKGPLLANFVTSHDLVFLCLTETMFVSWIQIYFCVIYYYHHLQSKKANFLVDGLKKYCPVSCQNWLNTWLLINF